MQIKIRVIPNAKQNVVRVGDDGALRVYVTTVPADGRANAAAIKILADHFGVAKSKITIIRGNTFRDKVVQITD